MTVEAKSSPPIHQRRFEIGLVALRELFTVVVIVGPALPQESETSFGSGRYRSLY